MATAAPLNPAFIRTESLGSLQVPTYLITRFVGRAVSRDIKPPVTRALSLTFGVRQAVAR